MGSILAKTRMRAFAFAVTAFAAAVVVAQLAVADGPSAVDAEADKRCIPTRLARLRVHEVYWGEEQGRAGGFEGRKVTYLTDPADRARHEVTIREGRIYGSDKTIPFNTRDLISGSIFVRAPDGKLYVSNEYEFGQFHHSTFNAGGPVSAAGRIWIQDGVVTRISNWSGHYAPTPVDLIYEIAALEDSGVDLSLVSTSLAKDAEAKFKRFGPRSVEQAIPFAREARRLVTPDELEALARKTFVLGDRDLRAEVFFSELAERWASARSEGERAAIMHLLAKVSEGSDRIFSPQYAYQTVFADLITIDGGPNASIKLLAKSGINQERAAAWLLAVQELIATHRPLGLINRLKNPEYGGFLHWFASHCETKDVRVDLSLKNLVESARSAP
jgi:hypothetical protein